MKLGQPKWSRRTRLARGILKLSLIALAAQPFLTLPHICIAREAKAPIGIPPIGIPPTGILYLVTTTDDHDDGACDADCTLREAIYAANDHSGTDGIRFSVTGTISLAGPLPVIFDDVSINGPGSGSLTVSGGGDSVFNVTATGTVSISGLTISNGSSQGGGGVNNASTGTVNITNCILNGNYAGDGGAIYNAGTLNVTNCTMRVNTARRGGGIYNTGTSNVTNCEIGGNSPPEVVPIGSSFMGGGIYNSGTLSVTNSTIRDNITYGDGGGIYNINVLNITNCTISGNISTNGNYLGGGGGIYNEGTANVANSSLNANEARKDGAGILNTGTVDVSNCTISGNTTIGTGGGIYSSGTVNLTNGTIAGNSASVSGGIVNEFPGQFNVKSSIIALNTAYSPTNPQDVYGNFFSHGFNLIGRVEGSGGFTAPTDLTGMAASPLDPKLDLSGSQNNGGTIPLICGSPAIDKGNSNGLSTDQRGFPRIADDPLTPNATGGDGTDIGAFELNYVGCPMPLPESQLVFTSTAASTPALSRDPGVAKPMGLGSVAIGGNTLDIQIGTVGFSGPAEVYFAVFSPQALGNEIYLYAGGELVAFSQAGLVPWIPNTNGPLARDLFGAIPRSALPPGDYTLYLAVAPAGSQLAAFYLWSAAFTVP